MIKIKKELEHSTTVIFGDIYEDDEVGQFLFSLRFINGDKKLPVIQTWCFEDYISFYLKEVKKLNIPIIRDNDIVQSIYPYRYWTYIPKEFSKKFIELYFISKSQKKMNSERLKLIKNKSSSRKNVLFLKK